MTTIKQVLDRLDEIIISCENTPSKQGYFALLYRRMTLAVQQGLQQISFADAARCQLHWQYHNNFSQWHYQTRFHDKFAVKIGATVWIQWCKTGDSVDKMSLLVHPVYEFTCLPVH